MAIKKPVVVTAGRLQQLQSGDSLGGGAETSNTTVASNQGTTIFLGQAVYYSGAGNVSLARGDSLVTSRVVGLVFDDEITTGNPGVIITSGPLEGTTAQWDVVTGQTGGLTPAAAYFLSTDTPGGLTADPPTTGVSIKIGYAESTTKFIIDIKNLIVRR